MGLTINDYPSLLIEIDEIRNRHKLDPINEFRIIFNKDTITSWKRGDDVDSLTLKLHLPISNQ